ncbi:hypothetical protein [Mucilaginibacter arboris]|uniref:Uncharacterized protein n=1 Tax=Mucilaginibacter arboris TaxID=2682090 RepID=A0A7K1T053_9SPHI|nr:hypothetical protein [Mucilaginibacter arboris]MVN22944.1 hypothetical protein [Mucilaginibacter arboris]
MEVFETVLAGSDGLIDGLVSTNTQFEVEKQYTFSSIDGSLTLIIARDETTGNWKRISSTEPYLSGWVDELGEQIDQRITPGPDL